MPGRIRKVDLMSKHRSRWSGSGKEQFQETLGHAAGNDGERTEKSEERVAEAPPRPPSYGDGADGHRDRRPEERDGGRHGAKAIAGLGVENLGHDAVEPVATTGVPHERPENGDDDAFGDDQRQEPLPQAAGDKLLASTQVTL